MVIADNEKIFATCKAVNQIGLLFFIVKNIKIKLD